MKIPDDFLKSIRHLTADQRAAIVLDAYYEFFKQEAKERQIAAALFHKKPLTVREYLNTQERLK